MVKLYNLSPISSEVLLPALELAKNLAKCHGNVVVKVTKGGEWVQSKAIRTSVGVVLNLGVEIERIRRKK
jgi:ribosomal protein S9